MRNHEPPTSRAASGLRAASLAGVALVLLWQLTAAATGLRPRQSAGLIVLVAAVPSALVVLFWMMPKAAARMARHPDVLVPLGLFTGAVAAVALLTVAPAAAGLLAPTWTLKVLAVGVPISVGVVLTWALTVVYVGWTTALVTQAVVLERVYLVESLAMFGRWFWRTLALELFGWGVLFAVAGVTLWPAGATPGALAPMALFSLGWNIATAGLLPAALAESVPFGEALKRGMRASLAGAGKWWVFVVVQMLMLGWLTLVSVSYEIDAARRSVRSWHVHAFWVGGYADTCYWHEDLMKALEAEPLAPVATLLSLLFAVLAVAVKLTVVEELFKPGGAAPAGAAYPEEG